MDFILNSDEHPMPPTGGERRCMVVFVPYDGRALIDGREAMVVVQRFAFFACSVRFPRLILLACSDSAPDGSRHRGGERGDDRASW
jgi:hypothetical protein